VQIPSNWLDFMIP